MPYVSERDAEADSAVGLAEAFAAAADATPDSVALVAAGHSATYKELDASISGLAGAIRRRVEPGRPVALLVSSGWSGLRGVFRPPGRERSRCRSILASRPGSCGWCSTTCAPLW